MHGAGQRQDMELQQVSLQLMQDASCQRTEVAQDEWHATASNRATTSQ